MPLDVSSNGIIEMNTMNSDSVWLTLLQVTYEEDPPIYVCLNNETITWNGNNYLPAIFSLSGITETKDAEVPSIQLTLTDLNRILIPDIEAYNGGVGSEVIIRIVNSKYLDNTTPELEETTEILTCTVDESLRVTFTLGAEDLSNRLCPPNRYLKNHCRFIFKGTNGRCGYTGSETDCNRTYARCVELNNSTRFGGFIGIGTSGVQV